MTRKDYVKIVNILNEFTNDANSPGSLFEQGKFDTLVQSFANMLAEDNPRFDYDRFFGAIKYYAD